MMPMHPDDHVYYQAARDADSLVAEHGMQGWLAKEDVDERAIVHLANQRGLRAVLTLFMDVDPADLNRPLDSPKLTFDIPPQYRALIPILAAAWMDGWACRHHLEDQTGV